MDEFEVFPHEAADVAMQAIEDGVARKELTRNEVYEIAKCDIEYARNLANTMQEDEFIKKPDQSILNSALKTAIDAVK